MKKPKIHRYINIYDIEKDRFMKEMHVPAGNKNWFVNDKGFICIELDGVIRESALEKSENGFTKFVFNNDNKWEIRYGIITECINLMATLGIRKDEFFAAFFNDKIAMSLKKDPENKDEWNWDRLKVHTASIYNLRHIELLLLKMHADYRKKYPEEYERMTKNI